MFNVQKSSYFGTILRSASAFNVTEVFLVCYAAKKTKIRTYGAKGTDKKLKFRLFEKLEDIRVYCKSHKIKICGVEIIPDAKPVDSHPFEGDTLFMIGD
jgi:tRNA G18 (ribose-2'-O)-methylase SpoU